MAIIDFLVELPLFTLAFVLTLGLVGFVLVGLWITRRWVLPRLGLRYDDAYYAAALVQSAMLLYGLVAALTAVGVWARYSQVSDVVSSEATAIASLWRDLGGYPEPVRNATRALLRGYTEQIIHGAWPQQRRRQIPREGVEWMDRLQTQLFAFEPATESQKILHAETLHAFNQLVQQRRQRLDSVQAGLPGVFWFVLLAVTIAAVAVLRRELWRRRATRGTLALFVVALVAYGFVYYGNYRYRAPLEPLMLLVCAPLLVRGWNRVRPL